MPKSRVVLYSRPGCHLCEVAHHVLAQRGLTPIEVNIDDDPELQARYGEKIPVVEIDGRERFFGRVDPLLLDRIVNMRSEDASPSP